ncbi:MAG: hypothetical protein V4532_00055 [Pseudomonadota bacterium]
MQVHFRRVVLSSLLASLVTGLAWAGDSPDAIYVGAGLPGAMVGYSRSVNSSWGWRADYAARANMRSTFKESGINYSGTTNVKRLGLFVDHFPMQNGFRVTGGLTVNQTRGRFNALFDGSTAITIGSTTITPTASQYVDVLVKMPVVTPYLGIGWGHHDTGTGLDFVADLGVMYGRLKIDVDTNVKGLGSPAITQADIDAEVNKIRKNGVGRNNFVPQASVGMSFRY